VLTELRRLGRRGFLGLGSNAGDRRASLRAARDRLDARPDVRVLASSSAYETEPQDEAAGQDDFLNACLEIETGLEPPALLDACKAIERELGRRADLRRHAPRPIDVDILLLGGIEYRDERLAVPHPDLTRRRFVLVPLLELDPALALPDGTRLAPMLDALEGQRVVPAGPL
jgi:2-amino-4-hydroxy-6-hydroxymethyldihydropteridine diphosphokinase